MFGLRLALEFDDVANPNPKIDKAAQYKEIKNQIQQQFEPKKNSNGAEIARKLKKQQENQKTEAIYLQQLLRKVGKTEAQLNA